MPKEELEKIDGILKVIDKLVLPLAEKGAEMTKNPIDDLAVAFLEGGVPGARKKIEELLVSQEQK